MGKPVIVFVGSSTPIQKILPGIVERGEVRVAAVYGSLRSDQATQAICMTHGIDFHPMKCLRGANGPTHLAAYHPDWVFNINSMILFGEALLAVPNQGSLNLHCGNLPEYAGKHAHQWAIRRGEVQFGVTLHWMTSHIDGGDIAGIRYFPIAPRDTGLSLYMKYIKEGIPLVEEVIGRIAKGEEVAREPQDQSKRHYFLDKEAQDGRIPWQSSQKDVLNFFRAADYAPFQSPTYQPLTYYKGVEIGMAKAKPAEGEANVPGKILAVEAKGLIVGTGTEPVHIRKVSGPEGFNLEGLTFEVGESFALHQDLPSGDRDSRRDALQANNLDQHSSNPKKNGGEA